MDELLIRVLTRLLRVHEELGERTFEEAAHRALVAIALAAQFEADRKAGTLKPAGKEGSVIRIPLASTRRVRGREDTEH